jgi:hypothetical protein
MAGAEAARGEGSSVPFTDPQADGYIGLCDLAGHNVTSGSTNSTPFVWKAVSSVQPPSAFRGAGQNADLNIYQARQDVDPGDWTGQNLVPATDYRRAKAPAAAATYKDYPLSQTTLALPPMWDGMYVLRMQFGRSGYGIYSATYPQTVIQVTGDRWHVISGGLVDCAGAKAVPQEVVVGVAKQQVAPAGTKGQTPPVAAPSTRATGSVAPGSTLTGPSAASTPGSRTSAAGNGLTKTVADPITAPLAGPGGTSKGLIAVIAVAAVIVLGLGAAVLARRRRTVA